MNLGEASSAAAVIYTNNTVQLTVPPNGSASAIFNTQITSVGALSVLVAHESITLCNGSWVKNRNDEITAYNLDVISNGSPITLAEVTP